MNNNVAQPNTNRGLAAGVQNERFGAFRDGNMSFPQGAAGWQQPPTTMSRPTLSYRYPILPTEHNYDAKWDNGTILFVKKDDNRLKRMYCLSLLRAMMMQSAIERHLDRRTGSGSGGAEPLADSVAAAFGKPAAPVYSKIAKAKRVDHSFLSTIESIAENLEFAGLGAGPTDPSLQVGTFEMQDSMHYSGSQKQVPFIFNGNAFMPKVFQQDLDISTPLYMIIKGVCPPPKFYNPAGDGLTVPKSICKTDLVPDVIFFASPAHRAPMYNSDPSALYRRKGEQPPLDDLSYIEWSLDPRTKDITNYVMAEMKTGLLWSIGHNYNSETSAFDHASSKNLRAVTAPLPFHDDYGKNCDLMQIYVNPKRVYAST